MKKRILPILLALIMVMSLMPTVAIADGADYEVKLPEQDVDYVDVDSTGYFFVSTALEVYRDGVKLEGEGIFDDDPFEFTSVEYTVAYKAQNGTEDYTLVPNEIINYGNKNSYFTIDFSKSEGDVFEAGVLYNLKVSGSVKGNYIPDAQVEGTFECSFEGILSFCIVPSVESLSMTSTSKSITIDYNDVGKGAYYIPVSIKNQAGIELAAICDIKCVTSNGDNLNLFVVPYEGGYAIQMYPMSCGIFESGELKFTAIYDNVTSTELKIDATVVDPQAAAFAEIDGVYYSFITDAIEAAIASPEDNVTINVLKGATFFNLNYNISKNIILKGEDVALYAEVAEGKDTIGLSISNGGSLTVDGIILSITGTENDDPAEKNDGTAIDIGKNASLNVVNGATLAISELNRGIVVGGGDSASFNVTDGSFYVNGIDGNLMNGGNVSFARSFVDIENVGDYGISAGSVSMTDSEVLISNVGISPIFSQGGDIDFENSYVSIMNSGAKLPYDDYTKAKSLIDYSDKVTGIRVNVGSGSTVVLTENKNDNINVGDGALTVKGSFNGNVVFDASASASIKVEGYPVQIINKGDTFTLPAAPSKPGYIFMGWKCSGGYTHQAGEVIEVTGNMTFTAIWANMPDITPGTPGGDDEPVVPDFPFTDVREGQWFYEAVKYVYSEGIMNGMDRYTFAPNGSLTRAMVWTMLARLDGVDTEGGATWYAKAQEWAVEAGVSDGTDPMGNITREQLVTMLWRLNGSETTTGSLTGYTDYDKVSDWAGNAMLWATVNGIIEGDEANALNPTAGCTRAQAAAMIMRFCENVELSPTV